MLLSGGKSQFQNKYPQVLIISLPIINEATGYASQRYVGGAVKSKELKEIYSRIAKLNNCHFIGATELEVGKDGVHLPREGHAVLANKLNEKIKLIKW